MSENWCALCAAKDQEIADLKRKTQAAEAQLLELRNTATEATEAWNSWERSCEQKDAEIADLKRQLEEARTPKWRCFHCGFETTNKSDAEAHFGEDSDEVVICIHWSDKTANEKLYEFQDTIKELNAERDYSAKLQTELAEARKDTERLRKLLAELHAIVEGECPSLLNEDSGGDAQLDMEIREAIDAARARG